MRKGVPWLCVATALTGCLQIGPAPSEGEKNQWDFRGVEGNYSTEVQGFGWLHMVVAATKDLQEADVMLSVSTQFQDPSDAPLGYWIYRGGPLEGRDGGSPSNSESCAFPDNGQKRCGQVAWTIGFDGADVRFFRQQAKAAGDDRPEFNYYVSVRGANSSVRTSIRAEWHNTVAAIALGESEAHVTAYQEDFIDKTPRNQTGLEYREFDLFADSPRLSFTYFVSRPKTSNLVADPSHPSYVRPNGSVEYVPGNVAKEISSQEGLWTFRVPKETTLAEEHVPVVWATRFSLAALRESDAL